MKKHILISMVLATVISGGVFAQTHWISADVSILGGGLRYEYLVSPSFTVGAYFYSNVTMFLGDTNTGFGAALRWYPFARRFFTELGLGYNSLNYRDYNEVYTGMGYESRWEWETYGGLGVIPGFGWTIDVGGIGGFFISPGLKIPVTLGGDIFHALAGTILYFGLGFAF